MSNAYIVQRTQIYLEDEALAEIKRRAAQRGTTASALIREAISAYLQPSDTRAQQRSFHAAVAETAGIADYLDRGRTYVSSLRSQDL